MTDTQSSKVVGDDIVLTIVKTMDNKNEQVAGSIPVIGSNKIGDDFHPLFLFSEFHLKLTFKKTPQITDRGRTS